MLENVQTLWASFQNLGPTKTTPRDSNLRPAPASALREDNRILIGNAEQAARLGRMNSSRKERLARRVTVKRSKDARSLNDDRPHKSSMTGHLESLPKPDENPFSSAWSETQSDLGPLEDLPPQ